MTETRFTQPEVPYDTLAKFGLTQEMLEDLPEEVYQDMLNGRRTPLLPISFLDDEGNEVLSRTRFMLVRKDDKTVDVMFYPQLKATELSYFTPEEKKALLNKQAIIAPMKDGNGNEIPAFHQIDLATNQILSVPTPVIGRNLQVISDELHLTNGELTCLQKGMPISIVDGDDIMHTIGIDLNEKTGVRFTEGNEKKWKEEMFKTFDKYNFGLNGCWVTDETGNLDYVPEDNYTQEMWEEQAKIIERRSRAAMKM